MHPKLIIGLFAGALLATSCSDDDDGGGGGPLPSQAAIDVLIGDAPVDDLLSFSAVVESVRIRRQDGSFTANFMATGPIRVELLDMNDVLTSLARAIIDEGDYTAVQIGFTPGSYEALDETGSPVTVTAASDTLLASFPDVFSVDQDRYARLEVDFDLGDSLKGEVSSGMVMLVPSGSTTIADGGAPATIEEFKGLVASSNQAGAEFMVEAFLDDEQLVSLGTVRVEVTGSTLYLDMDGTVLDNGAFFAALADQLSLVEIYGELGPEGVVVAERVEIEDQAGGSGSIGLVRLDGLVVDTFLNGFLLRVSEIEDGVSVAEPVLAGMGADDIEVAYGVDTVFVVGRSSLTDANALELGHEVSVEFCTFTTAPFPACIIELGDSVADFEGTITDVTGLPDQLTMRMDPDEVAITAGLVQDAATDVTVDLTGSDLALATEGEPTLDTADLLPGVGASIEGTFAGAPTAPTLTATRVLVRPGYLDDALVTLADEANSRFLTTGGDIVDPFGPNVSAGVQQVLIQPGATFSGDVASAGELFALLAGPQGATTRIDVFGIGDDVANEILAYHVHARTTGG